jgi:hypothetical protein
MLQRRRSWPQPQTLSDTMGHTLNQTNKHNAPTRTRIHTGGLLGVENQLDSLDSGAISQLNEQQGSLFCTGRAANTVTVHPAKAQRT